jgi:hypothetical protein
MLVQMFVEAKRHQPSVLYIPGLSQWASVLSSSAKATFTTLLDSLTPSEPVIIIAFMDEPLNMLDEDIKNSFGRMGKNLIELLPPNKVCCVIMSQTCHPIKRSFPLIASTYRVFLKYPRQDLPATESIPRCFTEEEKDFRRFTHRGAFTSPTSFCSSCC